MSQPKISLIAVLSEKTRAIGLNNQLLWKLPEDLKYFKTLTIGHVVIMGYKTFQSIGKPLPNRTNIVVSKEELPSPEGFLLFNSLEEALAKAKEIETRRPNGEVFIIGGGQVYHQTINLADRLYLTLVKEDKTGDTFFPDYSAFNQKIKEECHTGTPPYCFVTLEK